MRQLRVCMLAVAASLAVSVGQCAEAPVPPKAAPTDADRVQQEKHLDEMWGNLSLEAKTHLMQLHRALRELPSEDRRFIQDRVGKFLEMSAQEREKLKKNKQYWEKMTPEQRERARAQFEQRRRAFEAKWRREHPGQDPPPFPYQKKSNSPSQPPTEEPELEEEQWPET